MLHDKFTGIGEGTFRGCTSLKTIGYITSDGEEVVEENVVQLPASLTVLGNFAFGSGNSYVTKIKSNATGVEKVIISATVKSIGYGLFEDCTSLSSVENYGTVCSARMFDGCTSLESVVLNNNTTSIGDYAFNNCSSLTTIKYYVQDSNIVLGNANEVTLPAGVTSVGNYVFSGCSAITTVVFNGEVTSIGTSAFQNCTSLANITVPETATVATNAFDGCTSLPTTEEEGEDA
jgi:hypothetical protein